VKNKFFLAILVIALICVLLISCNAITQPESSVPPDTNAPSLPDLSFPDESIYINVSDGDDISDTDPIETSVSETSEPEQPDESSVPEVSTEPEKYVWYGEEELDKWYAEYKAKHDQYYLEWKVNTDPELYQYVTDDGRHVWLYLDLSGFFMDGFICSDIYRYIEIYGMTDDCNYGAICEYYGVTKEEYIEFCKRHLERHCAVPYGEKPVYNYEPVMLNWDAWFTEEYWDHPDFVFSTYDSDVYDCYYTSVPDRGNYTRRYYRIDYDLIQYVTEEEFYKWIDAVEDKEQNIVAFIEYFDIDEEEYRAIYEYKGGKVGNPTPYNPDYLFGTPEMQEEYFTVHPSPSIRWKNKS